MARQLYIQSKRIMISLLLLHIELFLFSGTCKQLPGLSLLTSELSDDEFEFLRNYLIENAYNSKEVYNVSINYGIIVKETFLDSNSFFWLRLLESYRSE